MPKISIIVPVYNVEKYLPRCLDSIIGQTFKDWECLVIDDGSTDTSGAICDEYARKDNRVKVFHKKNGGVSSARNIGLDNASGEWIMFVDSDDWLANNFSELSLDFESDWILFPYYIVHQKQPELRKPTLSGCGIDELCSKYLCLQLLKTPWSKLYRKDKISDLRFDCGMRLGEDYCFNLNYLRRISSIFYDDYNAFYFYSEFPQHFTIKYKMDVPNAIEIMNCLFNAYWTLGYKSETFERETFFDYKKICQDSIYINPSLWYQDSRVVNIYESIRKSLGLDYRIRHHLLSIPIISSINSKIKRMTQ